MQMGWVGRSVIGGIVTEGEGDRGSQEQCLVNQGIKQNNTMGGGSLRSAVFCGKNSTFRTGYIGLNGG